MNLCDMELYSVFRLYVIKRGNVKFICKKGNKENTFVEIFTKEKFIIKEESEVESLSSYYSLLEVRNYSTKEPLMFSKKKLLNVYLWLNEKEFNKDNSKDNNIKLWQDYVESKKDTQDIPIINVKELTKK